MKEKINIFFNKLKERRKIAISNPSSFEQKFSITLTRLGFIFVSLLTVILFSVIVYLVISYTPLRQLIPGYPDIANADKIQQTDKENIKLLSQIEKNNSNRELWIKNLKNILSDNDSILLAVLADSIAADSVNYKNIIFERPFEDSILREKVKRENILIERDAIRGILNKMNFSRPVNGTYIGSQERDSLLLGILLKTELNHPVTSPMKGIVLSKTTETVIIQHPNNMISIYKNCFPLDLNEGEDVSRGKQIGIVSDSILHFELWYNGKPITSKDLLIEE